MHKGLILWMMLLFFTGQAFAQKINKNSATGQWLTANNECIVEIYEEGDKLFGKFVWFKEPYDEKGNLLKDTENPDPANRNRLLLGMTFMFGFKWDGKNKWTDGKIYNPQDGKTYSAQLSIKEPEKLHLRGYFAIPALGRTEEWIRYKSDNLPK